MLRKTGFVVLILIYFTQGMCSQSEEGNEYFNQANQEVLMDLIVHQSLDSAYRYLNSFDENSLNYYLCWRKLAFAYWKKGDLSNASGISFWLKEKQYLFQNPNELFPELNHLIGNIYFSQNKLDSATAYYSKSIAYREKYTHIHDTMLLDTYQNLSQVYSLKSDSFNTFYILEKAKDIVYLQKDNQLQIASIYSRYADSYSRLAYYELAEKYYQEAFSVLDKNNLQHYEELAQLYTQKARLGLYTGKLTESIGLYKEALELYTLLNKKDIERANILDQRADVYYLLKDYESALADYLESLSIYSRLYENNYKRIILLHTDIASVYKSQGNYSKAIEHFRTASLKNKMSPAQYRAYGETMWKVGNLDKAEQLLLLANSIADSDKIKDDIVIADNHFWLGSFYLQTGRDKLLGLYYLNRAVGEFKTIYGDKNEPLGRALLGLAKYFLEENETAKALEIIQSSIISLVPGFYTTNPLINPEGIQMTLQSVANSLGWKARALEMHFKNTSDISYLRASFDTYELSLKLIEGFRLTQRYSSNLILNKEVKLLLDQAIQVSNKLYSLTQESKYFEATFSFIEQNKSTALLAALQQNDSLHFSNVPIALIEKENSLKQNIHSIQENLVFTEDYSSESEERQQRLFIQKKESLELSLDSLQKVLAKNYPDYYRLFYGNNRIGITQIQSQLTSKKVLIDYAINDTSLIVYVIGKNSANLYVKKKPQGFNNSILRLLQLIRYVNTENSFADFQSYLDLAHENYDLLLGDFISDYEGKELLIVPDGILSYLPFEILLTKHVNKTRPDYRGLPYFIKDHVSSTLSSAAIYFSYSKKKDPNYGKIVAFAPTYSFLENKDSINKTFELMPLIHVKKELESISQFFKPEIYKGKEATKKNFIKIAPRASVLHLAMHAVLNDKDPLESQLVFSGSNTDGYSRLFTVEELFGMDLSADLVVLSACNSGNGKLNKGEGIMSLSTGFQYAGVPSVVMTHWDVNDKYSADLMADFYTNLAKGLEKSKALHQAKLDMINRGSTIYSHPYYWAGFTLIGNESAIVAKKSGINRSLEFLLPIFILLIFALRTKRKSNG